MHSVDTMYPEARFSELKFRNVDELFDLYNKLHFTYPGKMERLLPVLHIVKQNWQKALQLDFYSNKQCR